MPISKPVVNGTFARPASSMAARRAAGKFFSYSHRSGVLESQSPACELLRAVERFGRRRRPTVEVTLDPQAAIADHDGIARLADRRGRWAARVEAAARRNRCRTWITPIDSSLRQAERSEEHTSELQSLMRISYAVFC